MKRRFLGYLLLVIFLSSASVALIIGGYGIFQMKTYFQNHKNDIYQSLQNHLVIFDKTLVLIERDMQKYAREKTLALADVLWQNGKFRDTLRPEALDRIAKDHNVSQIGFINGDGYIYNSSFVQDIGLDLYGLSKRFEMFLKNLTGKGDVRGLRISTSATTGKLNMYTYYSPPGSDKILNVSLHVRDFVTRHYSKGNYDFLFHDFFMMMKEENRYLKNLDIFIVTDNPPKMWSIIHEGSFEKTTVKQIKTILKKKEIQTSGPDYTTTYYTVFKLDKSGFDFTNNFFVRLDLDYGSFYLFIKKVILYSILTSLFLILVIFFISSSIFHSYFLERIGLINDALKKIARGQYDVEIHLKGNDDLSRIAENLSAMRDRIVDREAVLKKSREQIQKYADSLAVSEKKYRDIYENSVVGIYQSSVDGRVLSANTAMAHIFGYDSPREFISSVKNIAQQIYVNPEDRGRFIDVIKKRGHVVGYEMQVYQKNGNIVWVSLSARGVFEEKGGLLYMDGLIIDITQSKMAGEKIKKYKEDLEELVALRTGELKERENKYRLLAENSEDLIFTLDMEGRFTYVSPSFERLTGLSGDGIVSRNVDRIWKGKSLNRIYDFLSMLREYEESEIKEKIKLRLETKLNDPNGRPVLTECLLTPFYDEIDSLTGVLCVCRDISVWKKAEEVMRRSIHAAEAANRAKSEFLARMSHEIRTPMNGVIGMTHLLFDTGMTKEQTEYVNIIHKSAESLLSIINDILDYSKIEAGKIELETIDFRFRTQMEEILKIMDMKAKEKGLVLECNISSRVPSRLCGDVIRLQQILFNLTGNAIKFTEKGSVTINVDLKSETQRQVELEFKISDTGIGIPENRLNHLFQAFYQVDTSTTRKYGGTGLGLSISKRLIELMGGEIKVQSRSGYGSTFRFTVFFQKPDSEKDTPEDAGKTPALSSITRNDSNHAFRILVAEDNQINQRLILTLLKKAGFHATVAENGKKALEALSKSRFDLILMDVQMPEMDGLEATRNIRNDTSGTFNPNIPILAMTAYAMKGDREKCLNAGMDHYLTKPIQPQELFSVINRYILKQIDVIKPVPEKSDSPKDQVFDKKDFLARVGGNTEIAEELANIFIEDTPRSLAGLETRIEEEDFGEIRKMAHTLKGSSGGISAYNMQRFAAELEKVAEKEDPEKTRSVFILLKAEFDKLKRIIQSETWI